MTIEIEQYKFYAFIPDTSKYLENGLTLNVKLKTLFGQCIKQLKFKKT